MDCPESGAVNADATLWCWGNDEYGQLGTGDPAGSEVAEPTQVGTNDWSAISMGLGSACGIRSDPVARALENTLWCRGETPGGDELTPTQVGTATDWSTVSVDNDDTCATRTDDTLWCWGDNPYGQLGTGRSWLRRAPTGTPQLGDTVADPYMNPTDETAHSGTLVMRVKCTENSR